MYGNEIARGSRGKTTEGGGGGENGRVGKIAGWNDREAFRFGQ